MLWKQMKEGADFSSDKRWKFISELPEEPGKKNKWWCWCCDEAFVSLSHLDEAKHRERTERRTQRTPS